MTGGPANAERYDLDFYTQRLASMLVQDEVIAEAYDHGFRYDRLGPAIGRLACGLARVGEEAAAMSLADRLLTEIKADKDTVRDTWAAMAERGVRFADSKLRSALGLTIGTEGNTVLGENMNPADVFFPFHPMLSLYKLGDASIIPHLHQHIESKDGEDLQFAVSKAVKLFEAGDDTAYDLIIQTAKRAKAFALSQSTDEKAPKADDASDFAIMVGALQSVLAPDRSATEEAYAQADIALRYLAEKYLQNGDIERADEIQSLMLGRYDNAWLNARWFETGHDPEGKHAQAAKDFIEVYGEDVDDHALDITDALVKGGDSEAIEFYQTMVYDSRITPDNVDASIAGRMLAALHHSGDVMAHDRLVELLQKPAHSWKLVHHLDDMGLRDEAIAVARREFKERPNYFNGLSLVNIQYDADAMEAIQYGKEEYHHRQIDVIDSRIRHLGQLAKRIVELESQ